MDEFLFVGREEGLGDGVVETIPGATHGTPDVVVLTVRGEFGRCELRPAVAVKDDSGRWPAARDSQRQCLDDKVGAHVVGQCPAHNGSGVQVDDYP